MSQGQMIRMPISDIRTIGRNTQGVRLINLDEGDKLVSATTVEPDGEEVGGNGTEETAPEGAGSTEPEKA